uniref:Uncharacterized protein n=1 Tax=Romanomermis culicivorax TaxID=13658 RepID=A0A915K2T0_ROMCU
MKCRENSDYRIVQELRIFCNNDERFSISEFVNNRFAAIIQIIYKGVLCQEIIQDRAFIHDVCA